MHYNAKKLILNKITLQRMQQILSVLQGIYRELREANRLRRADFHYCLVAKPPFVAVRAPDGRVYKILADGTSSVLIGEISAPMNGQFCPYPEALWRLNFGVWMLRNRKHFPLAIMALLGLASLQFLLSLSGSSAAMVLPTLSAVMNCLLIICFATFVTAAVLWNFGKGVKVSFGDKDSPMLLSTGWPDISPDTLIVTETEDENPEAFADRLEAASAEQSQGKWLLVFAYRNPSGLVICSPKSEGVRDEQYFRRDMLCHDLSDWRQEVCSPRAFKHETWTDFVLYVRAFCEQYSDWSKWEKNKGGSPADDLIASMRAAATKAAAVLIPLLFAFNLNAQDLQPAGSAQPMPKDAGKSIFNGIPDSAKLEAYKVEMMVNKAKIGRELAPRMAFVMWVFHNWAVPVLFFFGLIALLVAKVSFKEALHDQTGRVIFGHGIAWYGHQARLVVFGVAILIAVVEIADSMITAFFAYESLWYGAFKCVGLAVLWYLFVTWITPNPQVEGGAQAVLRGGAQGNNYPRIG